MQGETVPPDCLVRLNAYLCKEPRDKISFILNGELKFMSHRAEVVISLPNKLHTMDAQL